MHISRKTPRKTVHFVAHMIHDKLHLTFAQCVQVLITGNTDAGKAIANRNIEKSNAMCQNSDEHKSLFGLDDFQELFYQEVEFAISCKNKVW